MGVSRKKVIWWSLGIVVALGVLGNLLPGNNGSEATQVAEPVRAVTPPEGMEPAPQVMRAHVTGFLKPGLQLGIAYVARSEAHQNATFLAARIVGANPPPAIGVWLVSGTPDAPGMTMSVNVYAKEFSLAPDGADTKAQLSMADPPARDLERFVESQLR